MNPKSDVDDAFRNTIKNQNCPYCDEPYSDVAVDWGTAWNEGRLDALEELEFV